MDKSPIDSWFEKHVLSLPRRKKIWIVCLGAGLVGAISANSYLVQLHIIKEPPIIVIPLQLALVFFWLAFAIQQFRRAMQAHEIVRERPKHIVPHA